MITQTILKDYADEKQPKLQLLSCEKKNWRLYYNRHDEPSQQEDDATAQHVADYVPQLWQDDVISEQAPDVQLFVPLLIELGLSEAEANEAVDND
ncbi:MAG: hypothetical protein EOM59_12740 [Clostridia bacterium]|nr:hypothetical protein [Clostridia bacterium]